MVALEHIGTQSFLIFSNYDRQSTFLVVYMFNKKKVIFINGWYKVLHRQIYTHSFMDFIPILSIV